MVAITYCSPSFYILLRRAGMSPLQGWFPKQNAIHVDFTGMTHVNDIQSLILIYV